MLQLALLVAGTAIVGIVLKRVFSARTRSRDTIDVGTISDAWLAEQRGAKRDSHS